MPCNFVKLPGGATAIVCGRGKKQRHCAYCGGPANLLCDWKLPGGKTCDLPICSRCSTHEGADKDYCKIHTHCDGEQR
jgi:hypothetical protein